MVGKGPEGSRLRERNKTEPRGKRDLRKPPNRSAHNPPPEGEATPSGDSGIRADFLKVVESHFLPDATYGYIVEWNIKAQKKDSAPAAASAGCACGCGCGCGCA